MILLTSGDRELRSQRARVRRRSGGYSLLLVMFLVGIGFLLMTGIMRWSGANSTVGERYNEYYTALAAAEGATEKVVSQMSDDFLRLRLDVPGVVDAKLGIYGASYPTAVELAAWGDYDFLNPLTGANGTYVARIDAAPLSPPLYTNLNWKYSGFGGDAASYRIISNARRNTSGNNVVAGVRQDIQVASIPLFEFAAFYAVDMELNPESDDFRVTGRVHSNGSIYCEPKNPRNVTFEDHVTAAHRIVHDHHPNDPLIRPFGSVTYLGERDSGVASLNLPIGTTNTPEALRSIVEMPLGVELTTSLLAQQRYCNTADLIIIVSNNVVVTKTAVNFALLDINIDVTNFVRIDEGTNFFNKRENKWIKYTEIDIGALINQYAILTTLIGHAPTSLYVADLRTQFGATQPGVAITNGQTLPAAGLTIATPNPLYIKGHYNAVDLTPGSTDTSLTKPASLIADAITVLSGNWNESNSGLGLPNRPASDTTINAAIVAGIVPSGGGAYSGGVENFIRLLEDWSNGSKTLTFNGSIAVLYDSQIALGKWGGPDVYTPPRRQFSFDTNFKDPLKLPPGTPRLRTVIRSQWAATQPNSTL